jgi:hypothetical protein
VKTLNKSCPYRVATVDSCAESGCLVQFNANSNLIILKGERVRDVFLNIQNLKNTGIKAADYILIKSNNSVFKFFLLEMSVNLHKPSVLKSKFENSLDHLDKIICCEQEQINRFEVKLIVAFKKVSNSSQFQVIFRSTSIKFKGKNLVLRNVRCNGHLEI